MMSSDQVHEASLGPVTMDPKLWSKLPEEILREIYKMLLIGDFYRLRMVCKDWNHVASQRRCFADLVQRPYFVLINQFVGDEREQWRWDCPTGTLAYNIAGSQWIWKKVKSNVAIFRPTPIFPFEDRKEPFAVKGLLYDGSSTSKYIDDRASFPHPFNHNIIDVTSSRKLCVQVPRIKGLSTLGMIVDTSSTPCFKLVIGSCTAGTLIFDWPTNKWETKPSRLVRVRKYRRSSSPKSCINCHEKMYVWSEMDEIQVYSLGDDRWSTLNPPPRHASKKDFRGLGHWDNQVYAVSKNMQATLSVWKLEDPEMQVWSEFERIPSALFSYLLRPGAKLPIVTTHCGEYFLMHVPTHDFACPKTHPAFGRGRRYVLLNIASKRWEIVDLPNEKLFYSSYSPCQSRII